MSRDDDHRRHESAARLRAAGIAPLPPPSRARSPLIYVVAVLGVAVLIGIAVLLVNRGSSTSTAATYPVASADGVVTLGNPAAPVKVELYEDYLCPVCKAFADRDHDALTEALNQGEITVRFHPVAILNELTTPAGYSTRSANAALCAADAGIFPAYHDKLFAEQPSERSAGLTDAQLIAFGTGLSAGASFGDCVTKGTYGKDVEAMTKRAVADTSLRSGSNFGTPTVTVNGTLVAATRNSDWLSDATGAR